MRCECKDLSYLNLLLTQNGKQAPWISVFQNRMEFCLRCFILMFSWYEILWFGMDFKKIWAIKIHGQFCGQGAQYPAKYTKHLNLIKKSITFRDLMNSHEKILYLWGFQEWKKFTELSILTSCLEAFYFLEIRPLLIKKYLNQDSIRMFTFLNQLIAAKEMEFSSPKFFLKIFFSKIWLCLNTFKILCL